MSIKSILFTSAFVFVNAITADSIQTIDTLNNSNQLLHLSANNADRTLCLNHTVPAFAKSLIIVQVTQLRALQDMLFEGILNDSSEQIRRAIQAGANVNLEREGKRPLLWAVTFHRMNAVRCLLELGAA